MMNLIIKETGNLNDKTRRSCEIIGVSLEYLNNWVVNFAELFRKKENKNTNHRVNNNYPHHYHCHQ